MNLFLAILLIGFWSGSYIAIHAVVQVFPPALAAAIRVAVALLVTLLYAWRVEGTIRTTPRAAWRCAVGGFCSMGVGWALLFWGQQRVTPAVAAILTSAAPIFTTCMLPLVDRRMRGVPRPWVGVLLGFAGVVCIFWPQLTNGAHPEFVGLLAVVGTAIGYGIAIAITHSVVHEVPASVGSVWHGVLALGFLVGWSGATEPWSGLQHRPGMPGAIAALLYLALCSTAIAQLIWFRLMRAWGGVASSTVLYCIPLVTVGLDAVLLRHWPTPNVVIGAVIILSGVALTQRHRPALPAPAAVSTTVQ